MNPTTLFPSLWHRRAASVTLMGSIVALGLLGYQFVSTGESADIVLYEALGTGVIGLLFSALARMPIPDRFASWFSFVGFGFAVAATGLGLMGGASSNIHVIFVLILSLLSVIAGLFGPLAWLILIAIIAPYVASHFINNSAGSLSSNVSFIAFYALPILASWLLWHNGARRASSNSGDKAKSSLAEQLVQVSNESEIVISTITDGVVALNHKGEVQLINPAAQKTLGWTTRDSMGLDHRSIIKLKDKQGNAIEEQLNPIVVTLHTNKSLERSDLTMETSSGKMFQARLSITPVGELGDGVIVVFRDITAEKAEEREQAEFVSTASHEMRTPVATIEGYLGLALNPNTATIDAKAHAYLTKAHESAQHLGRLFSDLLDVTKADDGRLRNLPMVTDLVDFCADIVSGMQTKASEKGLTLTFAPLADTDASERKLTPVYYADVDNDHLREVMNNLVENAIKYTKSGTVTVNVSGDNLACEITVHDSGIGIPREDISHLFQKFYRVDSSDTREIGGTGLGLYLCRRLVELIGGKIWVESDYGHGSTFFVSLPRVSFEDAQAHIKAMSEQREREAANEASKGNAPEMPTIPQTSILMPDGALNPKPADIAAMIIEPEVTPTPAPAPVVQIPVPAPQPPAPVAAAPDSYAISPEVAQQLVPAPSGEQSS